MQEGLFAVEKPADYVVDTTPVVETEKYLIFRSDGSLCGVTTDLVMDIITEANVTLVPMLPAHVSGVINLRGRIMPIIDFRLMLGQMPEENGQTTIVLNDQFVQVGIRVDAVEQLVDIEKRAILPVPYQNSQMPLLSSLVSGMYSLPDGSGTVMVLDCTCLLHEQ